MKYTLKHYEKKLALATFLLMATFNISFCQPANNPQELQRAHALYWKYRYKLIHDFVKIGDEQGMSMPFNQRYKWRESNINIGDGTTSLGQYICMLATEYKLLKQHARFKELEWTKTELYYAIKAYIRLDENYDGNNYTPGYFIRDDVSESFWENYESHFNSSPFNDEYTNTFPLQDPSGFISGFNSDYTNENEPRVKEMSGDQVLMMLLGFCFVKKCVEDAPILIKKLDGQSVWVNLVEMVQEETETVIHYVSRNGQPVIHDQWYIFTPEHEFVYKGKWLMPYAIACLKAAYYITGNYIYNVPDLYPRAYSQGKTLWWAFQFVGYPLFDIYQPIAQEAGNNNSTVLLENNCKAATISDSWRQGRIWPFSTVNSTGLILVNQSLSNNWHSFWPLAWAFLHDKTIDTPLKSYTDLIDAPCIGPYSFADLPPNVDPNYLNGLDGVIAGGGWGSSFRYRSEHLEHWDENQNAFSAFYPGMDYMILHNLYMLREVALTEFPFYNNLYHRYVDFEIPFLPNVFATELYGSQTDDTHIELGAYDVLEASCVLSDDAYVTFRAGNDILHVDGYYAPTGAEVYEYILPYQCIDEDFKNLEVGENTEGRPKPIRHDTLPQSWRTSNNFTRIQPDTKNTTTQNQTYFQSTHYSDILSNTNTQFLIYPNPNTGEFTIKWTGVGIKHVWVYDLIGSLALEQSSDGDVSVTINLGQLKQGTYIVRVAGQNQEIKTEKVVVY